MHRIFLGTRHLWTVDGRTWCRRFGKPRSLGNGVFLTGTVGSHGLMIVNGFECGDVIANVEFRIDVTDSLDNRNLLELVLESEISELELAMEIEEDMA